MEERRKSFRNVLINNYFSRWEKTWKEFQFLVAGERYGKVWLPVLATASLLKISSLLEAANVCNALLGTCPGACDGDCGSQSNNQWRVTGYLQAGSSVRKPVKSKSNRCLGQCQGAQSLALLGLSGSNRVPMRDDRSQATTDCTWGGCDISTRSWGIWMGRRWTWLSVPQQLFSVRQARTWLYWGLTIWHVAKLKLRSMQ